MEIKVSEATDIQIDWLVANYIGLVPEHGFTALEIFKAARAGGLHRYSTDRSQGELIIEREKIEVKRGNPLHFPKGNEQGDYCEPLWIAGKQHGKTPMIAAWRCFLTNKLGEVAYVPDELCDHESESDRETDPVGQSH